MIPDGPLLLAWNKTKLVAWRVKFWWLWKVQRQQRPWAVLLEQAWIFMTHMARVPGIVWRQERYLHRLDKEMRRWRKIRGSRTS